MSWLIHSSIQLAIFTVIVAFFAMLFRKSSAQILFILFLLIFVKALIPPGFALPCGVGNWGLEPVRYYVVSFFETRKTIDETAPYQAIHDVEHHSPPVNPERFQVETVAATRISQDEMSTVSTVSTVSKILFWITNNPLLSIWLVGFCGALGILIRSSIKISLLIHRSREVERGKFQGLYGKARIYISDETLIPFVAGFWRQNIILPQVLFDNEDLDNEDLDNEDLDNEDLDNEDLDNEDLENLSDSRKKLVENILLHEQAHLMRMDIPIAYFVALVQACFWFHPFLWWAGRQLALWRERACDEMVLASERTNSELYGRALLDVLLLAQGKNTTRYTALGIFERNVKIQTRLEKIMSYHKTPYQFRCEWILLIFFAFCFLPMGCYVFSDDVKPVRENQSSVKQTEDQITEKSVPVLKNKENIIIEFYVLASNKTTDEKEKALMASASGDASASGNDQSEYRSDILDGYEGVRWLPVLETLAEQWKRISIEKNAGVILRRKESDKGLEMEEVLVLIPSKERRIVPDDFEQINYESQNGMDQIKFSLTAEGGKRMKRLSMPLVEKSPKTARTPRFLAVVRVQENLRILVTAAPVYAELERHGLVQFEGISKKNSVSQPSVISCRENLKQIVLAFHNYYAIDNKFPPSATVDSKGKPLHSWRVLILPYLEQNDLYKKIRLNEPWDSEYNKQFHDQMPDVYRCTVKNYGPGMTIFSVVTGKEAAFPRWGLARGFENITDGTSNTLAVVERKKPVCWMDPTSDITFTEAVNNDINSSSGDGLGSQG